MSDSNQSNGPNGDPSEALLRFLEDRILGTADRLTGAVEPPLEQVKQEIEFQEIELKMIGVVASTTTLPARFSWEDQNYVTPAKFQKYNDCWAFATAGAAETAYQKAVNRAIPNFNLSEQSIVDCSNMGTAASGGYCAFKWLVSRGVHPEADYPYQGYDQYCQIVTKPVYKGLRKAYVPQDASGYSSVDALKRAIFDHGPVYTTILATAKLGNHRNTDNVFVQYPDYKGGINHAVIIVGWDDNKTAAGSTRGSWRVKNSWGQTWGRNGIGWIRYGENGIGKFSEWIDMDPVPREPGAQGPRPVPIPPVSRPSLEG